MSAQLSRPLPLVAAVLFLPVSALAQVQDPADEGPQIPTTSEVRAWQPGADEAGGVSEVGLAPATGVGSFVTPIHTAPDDPVGGSYGVWAAGADYKVGFAPDMTFYPYLGKDYPVTRSLNWRTIDATVGGQSLLTGQPARPWHSDVRYEYHHGGVVEAYDVLVGGLEQTFVLAEKPATVGEFLVRGRIDANLHGALQSDGSIRFADDQGRVLVEYGAATVVDAAGKSLPLATDYDGEVVTLRVPASWMATATFPVTIDPLLSVVSLQLGVSPAESISVVRADGPNTVLQAYARFVSATDADAWGRTYPDGWSGGGAGTLVFTDITTSWSTPKVSCAVCGPQATFVIALGRDFPGSSQSRIRVWAQPTSTATTVTAVLFPSGSSTILDTLPSVGGIPRFTESGSFLDGEHCLIAYQRDASTVIGTNVAESEIWGLLVDCTTSPATLGTPFEIGVSTAARDQENPCVTPMSEGGTPSHWLVAYQEYNNTLGGDDWDAYASRVDSTGAVATARWFPISPGGNHKIDVHVAGQNGRYGVFYCRVEETGSLTKVSGYEGTHVDSERFDWPVGGSITKFDPDVLGIAFGGDRYLRVYGLSHDTDTDSFWCGLWHATPLSPSSSGNMFVDRVGFDGERVEGNSIPDGSISYTDGGISYNDDGNNFVFAYGTDDAASTHPILGNVHAFPNETSPTSGGLACNSVSMTWTALDSDGTVIGPNNQQIGHQFGRLSAFGAPATGFHIMQLSTDPLDVVVVHPLITPGCRLLVDVFGPGYLGSVTDFGPSVSWQIPLPSSLSELTLHCQDWIYDLSTDLLTSSDRLSIEFVKD
jgi:hypothetical protein